MVFEPIDFDGDHPRVGSLFLAGWQSLIRNIGDWLVTTAVAVGVLVVVLLLGALAGQTKEPLILVMIFFIAIVAGYYIQYGFARTALAIARGSKPQVGDVWRPDRLVPYVVFYAIASCMAFTAFFILPILGSILVFAAVLYAPFFILEGSGSAMTGLWQSVRATITNSRLIWQLLFILFSLFLLFSFVGAFYLTFGIGALAIGSATKSGSFLLIWGLISGVVSALVFFSCLIMVLSAAATAYVHLDSNPGSRGTPTTA